MKCYWSGSKFWPDFGTYEFTVCISYDSIIIVVDSIIVVGVLTHTLLHAMCNVKATQKNMQHSLIQELLVSKFEQDHNAAKTAKNICC